MQRSIAACYRALLTGLLIALVVARAIGADEAKPDPSTAKPLPPVAKTSVGVAVKLNQFVIPGSELEAKPIEDRQAPVVLRVLATYPHGSDTRYDFEFYGLEAGTFDLRDYLKRKDGSPLEGTTPVLVEIGSRLPPGQILPSPATPTRLPAVGGYRWVVAAAVVVWAALLSGVLLARRRVESLSAIAQQANLSPAQRLRPLVAAALEGALSPVEKAELERTMHGYWRAKLGLVDGDPVAALAALRRHPEAGTTLQAIELWLHHPDGERLADIHAALAPYRNVADEAGGDSAMLSAAQPARGEPSPVAGG